MKTSREASETLRKIADFLDSRSEFELNFYYPEIFSFYEKNKFVAAAKAIGDADKVVDQGEYAQFKLVSRHSPVTLSISRDYVCKKVVKYECEPLFTTEEISNL